MKSRLTSHTFPYLALHLALALVVACGGSDGTDSGGDGDGDGDADEPEVVSLTIEPADAAITVVDGAPASQSFTVTAEFSDGSVEDVTATAGYSYTNSAIGLIDAGIFKATGSAGGTGTVIARLGLADATATMSVFIDNTRVADGAPAEAPDIFDQAGDDPALAPTVVYPSAGTFLPPNLGDFEVHWQPAAGTDLFEVSLTSAYASVKLYAVGNWQAFAVSEWDLLSESARGETVSISVRGLAAGNPATAGTAAAVTTTLTQQDIEGGIYYWASTGQQPSGIYRHDMAKPGEPAEAFYTTNESVENRCVACHVLSRDGERMALTYDGGNGPGTIIDVATRTPQLAVDGTFRWNFASFVPGSIDLLAVAAGNLSILDGTTGTEVTPVPTNGWATHPDFAPDASAIVYTEVASPSVDWAFTGGRIVTQTYDASTRQFGAVTPLVTAEGNHFYPSWSPDSQWILFNTSSEDAYDDATAELFAISADGTVGPIKLNSPNVGGNLTNSWARWAPFAETFTHPDGTREPFFWFTFSSKRAFGVRLPGGQPQVWMAPFFPERAMAGADPSGPAFRLPFQALDTNNHIAQWTERVVVVD